MPDYLTSPWAWLILGLVLIGLETLVPGIFLVWFGVAAVLTALLDWTFGLSWQANASAFALLALFSALAGWRLTRRREEEFGDTPMLNRRAEALVGRVFSLEGPLVAGEGRVRVDDSVWRVTGPDLPAGTRVEVAQVKGTTLVVKAAGPGVGMRA